MVKQHEGVHFPFITIDATAPAPVYKQLEGQLRAAILQGTLRNGTRLPASRVLADELGISRPTVVKVLESLMSEGFLEARQGSGTFVAPDLPQHLPQKNQRTDRGRAAAATRLRLSEIGALTSTMTADLGRPHYRPFLPNHPALEAFPLAAWRKCRTAVARAGRLDTMGYGDVAGYAPLRKCIAEYLALHRGDACDPDQIIITPGSHAGFALAALLLANPGEGIWFEDPGPLTVFNLFRALALDVRLVKVDRDGMDVETAIACHRDARLAFVMPSRHHPLGVTLSLPRRLAILEWARHNDAWIIEDDYDSEFRYVGRPLPSMRSIDAAERVIYAGTFSKALYPSIRVGYLVLPPQLVGLFRSLGGLINRGVSIENQAVLAEFINRGHFVTHLRRMRDLYVGRRAAFSDIATKELGGLAEVDCPDSGMNAIAWLSDNRNDSAVQRSAIEAGVQCFPLSDYTVSAKLRSALILGFTGVPADRMPAHFKTLAQAITRPRPG